MLYLVNTDVILTLDDVDIEELQFCPFLDGVDKQSIKLFDQYFKENPIMCCHKGIICFNFKKGFVFLVNLHEYSLVRQTSENIDCDEDIFE